MAEKGVVRRVMRGLYDYPAYSKLLKKDLKPDIDQVAQLSERERKELFSETATAMATLKEQKS